MLNTIFNELDFGGQLGHQDVHLSDRLPQWRALARKSWGENHAQPFVHADAGINGDILYHQV